MPGPGLPSSVLPEPRRRRGPATWHHAERSNRRTHAAHTHNHGGRGRAPGDSRYTQDFDPHRNAAYIKTSAECHEGAPLGPATRSPRPSLLHYEAQRASFSSCRIQGPATPPPYTPSLWPARTDTPQKRHGHGATLWETENMYVIPRTASVPRKRGSPDTSPPTPLPRPPAFFGCCDPPPARRVTQGAAAGGCNAVVQTVTRGRTAHHVGDSQVGRPLTV